MDPWETFADWWRASFTQGADAEYEEQILPLAAEAVAPSPGMRVLDAGCGEGQVARRLAVAGAQVVGVDRAWAQLEHAREAGGGPTYVRGALEALPLADGCVDAAIVVLVLEHLADLDAVHRELARVVCPSGRLVIFLNHPIFQTPDSGWVDDHILHERYWRVGPYLSEVLTHEEVDPGVVLPYYHRTLATHVNGLVDAGFSIERILEPQPPPGFLADAPEFARSPEIPRLLVIVASR